MSDDLFGLGGRAALVVGEATLAVTFYKRREIDAPWLVGFSWNSRNAVRIAVCRLTIRMPCRVQNMPRYIATQQFANGLSFAQRQRRYVYPIAR